MTVLVCVMLLVLVRLPVTSAHGIFGNHHHHSKDEDHPSRRILQQRSGADDSWGQTGQYDSFQDFVASDEFRETGARCGTPHPDEEALTASEEVFQQWLEVHPCNSTHCPFVSSLAENMENTIQISVVWHSIRKSDGTNGISSAMLADSISVLNSVYASSGFSFVLSGTTTTNNDAWYKALPGSSEELQMKSALRSGDCSTLNVYSGGSTAYLGWTYQPEGCRSGKQNLDGVVIAYQTAPGGTLSPYNRGIILVHEVGHWLGLFHTFQGGCGGEGDYVADTPSEAIPDYDCEIGRDSCPELGADDVTNYMDFGDDFCVNHFTKLQTVRMHAQYSAYRFPTPGPTLAPSTPAPTPAPAEECGCFSESATVLVRDKGYTEMGNLKVGDQVMTASGFQRIYGWAHNTDEKKTPAAEYVEFLSIHTKEHPGQPLQVTGEHLLFVVGETNPVRADSIVPGVYLVDYEHNLKGALVTKIDTVPTTISRTGLYAPLTPSGKIVVDGIVASCYISVQRGASQFVELQGGIAAGVSQHFLCHVALAPTRMICVGISSEICKSYNKEGLAHFVQFYFKLASILDHQEYVLVQLVLLVLFMMVFGPLYVLEWIMGPKLSVLVIIGCAIGVLRSRGSVRISKGKSD